MSLVIFDLDNTLIFGQSQRYLLFYLYKRREISLFFLLSMMAWFVGYKLGIVNNPKKAMMKSFMLLKNKSIELYNKIFNDFYEDVLKSKLNPLCLEKLAYHKKRNDRLVLLSNVIKPLADVVSEKLDIGLVLASEPEIKNGFYTGGINGEICYENNKAKVLKKFFSDKDFADSYAYADHFSDLIMLNMVKNPVAVNPDPKLFLVAKKNNWLILK
jgi:HAD superfamily hydrolase (TIGR01490 family)